MFPNQKISVRLGFERYKRWMWTFKRILNETKSTKDSTSFAGETNKSCYSLVLIFFLTFFTPFIPLHVILIQGLIFFFLSCSSQYSKEKNKLHLHSTQREAEGEKEDLEDKKSLGNHLQSCHLFLSFLHIISLRFCSDRIWLEFCLVLFHSNFLSFLSLEVQETWRERERESWVLLRPAGIKQEGWRRIWHEKVTLQIKTGRKTEGDERGRDAFIWMHLRRFPSSAFDFFRLLSCRLSFKHWFLSFFLFSTVHSFKPTNVRVRISCLPVFLGCLLAMSITCDISCLIPYLCLTSPVNHLRVDCGPEAVEFFEKNLNEMSNSLIHRHCSSFSHRECLTASDTFVDPSKSTSHGQVVLSSYAQLFVPIVFTLPLTLITSHLLHIRSPSDYYLSWTINQ